MTLNLNNLRNEETDSQGEEEDDLLFSESGRVRPKTHRVVNLSHTHGQIFKDENIEQGLQDEEYGPDLLHDDFEKFQKQNEIRFSQLSRPKRRSYMVAGEEGLKRGSSLLLNRSPQRKRLYNKIKQIALDDDQSQVSDSSPDLRLKRSFI